MQWQPPSSGTAPTAYEWEVRSGGLPGTGGAIYIDTVTTTSASFQFAGAGTVITFWVRPVCGSGVSGNWTSYTVNYCTFEPPYFLDFNASGPPPCSENVLNIGDVAGMRWGAGGGSLGFCHHLDPSSATFSTAAVNLQKDTSYTLSFDWHGNSDETYRCDFFGILPSWGSGTMTTQYIPSSTGGVRMSFTAATGNGGGCYYADNLSIVKTSCSKPRNVRVTGLTPTSAILRWDRPLPGTLSTYQITYNGITVSSTTDTSIALTGLTPGTTYHYTVNTICSGSSLGVTDSFTTYCQGRNVPYNENFETVPYHTLPACTRVETVGSNPWQVESSSSYPYGFTGQFIMSRYSSAPKNTWFYTPGLTLETGKLYRLTFRYGNNSPSLFEKLEVKYGLAPLASAMINMIVDYPSINLAGSAVSSTLFSPVASGVYYLGFHAYSANPYDQLYLDEISLTDANLLNVALFLDKNSNAIKDAAEPFFGDAKVVTTKVNVDTVLTSAAGGRCSVNIDTGNYVTTVIPYRSYYTSVPALHVSNYSTYLNVDTAVFALQPLPGARDLSVTLFPTTAARPGFAAVYRVVVKNKGTDTVASALLNVVKDNALNVVLTSVIPASVTADTISWTMSNLYPDDTRTFDIVFAVPASMQIGSSLLTKATVTSPVTDLYSADNVASEFQQVRGSYDPNDKTEAHGGAIKLPDVLNGEYLTYTIRFQNTGNDTAFNINVRDTLSNLLDGSSFEMLAASEDYRLTMEDGNKLLWTFNNVQLVDSNTNEIASHGYIVYRIRPKTNVNVGEVITNIASIYFDYNQPVRTNIDTTVVVDRLLPLNLLSFTAQRQGKHNLLQWRTSKEVNVDRFEVERSANGREFRRIDNGQLTIVNGRHEYRFTDENPLNNRNYYRLKIVERDGGFSYSPVRMVNNSSDVVVKVYPNPAKEKLQVSIESNNATQLQMQVVDAVGKVISSATWQANEGASLKTINISSLQTGSYYLKLTSDDGGPQMVKFVKL